MDNMYDILAKMNLLEGRGSKPDFIDLDKDGDKSEPMKQAAKQAKQVKEGDEGFTQADYDKIARKKRHLMILNRNLEPEDAEEMAAQKLGYDYDEVLAWVNADHDQVKEGSTGDYSAKKARAGKDIGKPGKQFAKIAKSAGERYGSKERGEKVAGAVLAKLRKEDVNEADMEEGNEFSGELAKAKAAGKQEFEVDGKKYQVKEAAKPDYIDLDKDGNKKESMKKAAQDKKKKMKESMALVKVLEGNDRRAEVFVDREYNEYQVRLHADGMMSRHFTENKSNAVSMASAFVNEALDINLVKAMQKGAKPGIKDPESERNIHKKYGYRSDRDDEGGEDDDYDEWGNLKPGKKKAAHVVPGEKRGRGRPKGSGGGKRLGAKSTGLSKLARGAAIREEEVEEAIGDPENTGQRAADRKQLARDHKKLDDLERRALEKAKQTKLPAKKTMGEDYDKDEYDEEGEMAQSQARSIEDAAEELQSILDANENLPEWVQKKITLAQEYIDSARDYLKANRPEDDSEIQMEGAFRDVDDKTGRKISDWLSYHADGVFDDNPYLGDALIRIQNKWDSGDMSFRELKDAVLSKFEQGEWQRAEFIQKFAPNKVKITQPDLFDEEAVSEKAVSKAQRKAAGIAYAAKKGDIPKSELRGASKEMSDMPTKELKKFAKTKEKDLPAKKDESVEETTTAGSVATSDEAPKSKKGGMQFGKGVYEGRLEESFQNKMSEILGEEVNATMNASTQGDPSVTVTATGEDAAKLGELLKLAGLFGSSGYQRIDAEDTCSECGGAGMHEAGCSQGEMVEEEMANKPDPAYAELGATRDYGLAGGVNGPKLQVNPNNMGDNPMAMRDLGRAPSGQVNLGAIAEQVEQDQYQRMLDLYKRIS
jgi:hypothetical protein